MKAEIIAVGSEMLTPDYLDTNSLFITERLNEAGCEVHLKTVVGDSEQDIANVLREALRRSDLIIFSGGLGPTEDDLTRVAVAEVLKRAVTIDPVLVEALRRRFASRGYQMPKINERQALVIDGASILDNPFGTAPGMWLEEGGAGIALLPGPPRELKPMLEKHILPRVQERSGGRRLASRQFHVTGMTESEVDSRVAPVYRKYPEIRTIILAKPGHIALRISRWVGPAEEPADLEELASQIQGLLGDAVFSSAREPLEEVVGRMLLESGQTLAVAESCTSGMIGARITRIPGSSRYFLGGVLCYSNEVKKHACGVPSGILEEHGAVSAEVAEALAGGVREKLGSSIALSVTGIAGPDGGSSEKPVGLVFVGIADGRRVIHFKRIIPGDRETIRERATYFALSSLRKFLLSANR
jgi:nicotinamide-nucleotide amidase